MTLTRKFTSPGQLIICVLSLPFNSRMRRAVVFRLLSYQCFLLQVGLKVVLLKVLISFGFVIEFHWLIGVPALSLYLRILALRSCFRIPLLVHCSLRCLRSLRRLLRNCCFLKIDYPSVGSWHSVIVISMVDFFCPWPCSLIIPLISALLQRVFLFVLFFEGLR